MKTYSTHPQYLADCTDRTSCSHRSPVGPYLWTCDTCGKVLPHTDGYGIMGHAMVCYGCCAEHDRAEMLDRSKPFVCYLSSDGKSVTSWPGGILGRVTWRSESRTGWHGSRLTHVRVRDSHGAMWHGKGSGPGMCITLRASKGDIMKTPKPLFYVEMTDTFGGEANYCWVNRFIVRASTERGAIGMVTRKTGYRARASYAGRYDVPGAAVCYFIEWIDEETAKSYQENYSRIEVLP